MTREEALRYWELHLERAEEWNDPHWEASERKAHKEYVDAMKMAIEALKAQENMIPLDGEDIMFVTTKEYKAQEWIPCSERLPKEHEWIGTKAFGTTISDEVLVTFDVDGTKFVKPLSLQNGKLSRPDAQTMDVFYKGWKMLAWMPLPEPYKESDTE